MKKCYNLCSISVSYSSYYHIQLDNAFITNVEHVGPLSRILLFLAVDQYRRLSRIELGDMVRRLSRIKVFIGFDGYADVAWDDIYL